MATRQARPSPVYRPKHKSSAGTAARTANETAPVIGEKLKSLANVIRERRRAKAS
jgi:hypothetical protein